MCRNMLLTILFCITKTAFSRTKCQKNNTIGSNCEYAEYTFKPNKEWSELPYKLKKGSSYKVLTRLDSNWSDAGVKADLKGWTTHKFIAGLFSIIRRTKNIGFYQIGICEDKKYKNINSLDKRVVHLKANYSSKPMLFVNDVAGYAHNNKGRAYIRIELL